MRYQISGQQIDIGEALQNHVRNELNVIIQKYAERPVGATISFSKDAHEFVCEATVHLSTGLTAQAKARAVEIYAAFDNCGEKMEMSLHHSQSLFIAQFLGIVNTSSKRTRYHETDRLSRR